MFFNILGSLTAYIFPMMVIGSMVPENTKRVLLMSVIAGAIAATPLLGVFLGTREKKEFIEEEKPKLIPSLKAAFKNRPFIFCSGYLPAHLDDDPGGRDQPAALHQIHRSSGKARAA